MAALIGEATQTIGITNQTYGIQDLNSCIPPVADKALNVKDPPVIENSGDTFGGRGSI